MELTPLMDRSDVRGWCYLAMIRFHRSFQSHRFLDPIFINSFAELSHFTGKNGIVLTTRFRGRTPENIISSHDMCHRIEKVEDFDFPHYLEEFRDNYFTSSGRFYSFIAFMLDRLKHADIPLLGNQTVFDAHMAIYKAHEESLVGMITNNLRDNYIQQIIFGLTFREIIIPATISCELLEKTIRNSKYMNVIVRRFYIYNSEVQCRIAIFVATGKVVHVSRLLGNTVEPNMNDYIDFPVRVFLPPIKQ